MIFRTLFGQPAIPSVSAPEAKARQDAGALIVDVREPYEWAEGHIPGALHIPLGSLAARARELNTARELVIVCHSGNRSGAAVAALQRAGYQRVNNLDGGMIAWARMRLPVTR